MPSPNFPNGPIRGVSPCTINSNSFYPQYDASNPPLLHHISLCYMLAVTYCQHVLSSTPSQLPILYHYPITLLRKLSNCTISKGGTIYYHVYYLPICRCRNTRRTLPNGYTNSLHSHTDFKPPQLANWRKMPAHLHFSLVSPPRNIHHSAIPTGYATYHIMKPKGLFFPTVPRTPPSIDYYFICICPLPIPTDLSLSNTAASTTQFTRICRFRS